MEQCTLKNSLIFSGIPEDINENNYSMREKVYSELTYTWDGEDFASKLVMAKNGYSEM